MNKFGLIETFTKIAQDKNAVNLLSSTFNSLLTNNLLSPKSSNLNVKKSDVRIQNKYSHEAIIAMLKRHDEISKQIDLNLKNQPPKK